MDWFWSWGLLALGATFAWLGLAIVLRTGVIGGGRYGFDCRRDEQPIRYWIGMAGLVFLALYTTAVALKLSIPHYVPPAPSISRALWLLGAGSVLGWIVIARQLISGVIRPGGSDAAAVRRDRQPRLFYAAIGASVFANVVILGLIARTLFFRRQS
jgi:hypothetical protein